jgi:NAD(P)-dependent dehydrogenase (short-subunit alcohol dehydrogenase family)
MKLSYRGKSAVITGASGGMGLEISKKLSQNNISVLMLDLQNPSKDFLNINKNCQFKKVDVTNFNKMKSHIDAFYKKQKSIDYLVNTTGVLWFNKDVSAVNINSSIWDKVFEINLKSMMYLSKIVVPKMRKNKFGSMVHISSVDALSGDDKPQDAYGASKAAMIRLSKSFAIQFASSNVRSNIILPGSIETGMQIRWKKNPKAKKSLEKFIPLKRVGKPEDISNASMFLLSDQANYITGTEMIVDGGITSKP